MPVAEVAELTSRPEDEIKRLKTIFGSFWHITHSNLTRESCLNRLNETKEKGNWGYLIGLPAKS